MTYWCRDCGLIFGDEEAEYYQLDAWSEVSDLDYENSIICPECHSLDVEEYKDEEQSTALG